eukprot:11219734-Lingulodinium_polyedra.AAC.1
MANAWPMHGQCMGTHTTNTSQNRKTIIAKSQSQSQNRNRKITKPQSGRSLSCIELSSTQLHTIHQLIMLSASAAT